MLGGVSILAVLVWQLGTGPFLDGVRAIDGSALAVALAIGLLTTVCAAWRWSLIAGGLGVKLPLGQAVSAYYRSQFLNSALPGGVVGDVHRAVRHGLDLGDVGLGVRAVVLERITGQTVQVAIAVVVLLSFPSPVRSHMPALAAGVVAVALAIYLVAQALPRSGSSRLVLALRRAASDVRDGLATTRTRAGVVLASAVVLTGHLAIFLVAARSAGSTAPLPVLVPLTLFALFAMVLPFNIAGWGLREGAAAWAFGAAGLTATQGVAVAVTYGVLAFVASLPGAGLLITIRRVPAPALGHAESNG